MQIAVGSDHAGFRLKADIINKVRALGHEVTDFGTNSLASCNYCDFALVVAHAVASGTHELGILICGTGIGMSIAANKVTGAYAARCSDTYSARMAREHNAANILCLGERVTGPGVAEEIVQVFLTAVPSEDQRHVNRRACIWAAEQQRDHDESTD